jgi:hypothetical protein
VYDVVPVHGYAYVSRRNIVHAYDVIPQPDTATRSGNVTLSVADILSVLECFFRVNRALKVLEPYIPYELATASAVPTIYANDLSTVYDLGASINAIKTASAFDKLVVDYATYTKSYSPLFFTLLRRKTPIRYLTLPVSDRFDIADYASVKKVVVVAVSDYVAADSASARGVVTVLVPDYGLLKDSYGMKNLAIHVFDIITIADSALANKAQILR